MWTVSEWRYVLLAAAVTVFAAMPVAIAEADGPAASTSASLNKANKKIKSLSKRVRALEAKEASLGQRLAALEASIGVPAKPSGPAGGDLFGAYPDPQIAPNVVGAGEIANNAVGRDEIADDAVATGAILNEGVTRFDLTDDAVTSSKILNGNVGLADLETGSIGARALGDVFSHRGPEHPIFEGQETIATVTCPTGTRLLSGGFEWFFARPGTSVINSSPSFDQNPSRTWQVRAILEDGAPSNSLFAEALCLRE